MRKYFENTFWIVAFLVLCAFLLSEVIRATQHRAVATDIWICPILGKCGPPGTPGLGEP